MCLVHILILFTNELLWCTVGHWLVFLNDIMGIPLHIHAHVWVCFSVSFPCIYQCFADNHHMFLLWDQFCLFIICDKTNSVCWYFCWDQLSSICVTWFCFSLKQILSNSFETSFYFLFMFLGISFVCLHFCWVQFCQLPVKHTSSIYIFHETSFVHLHFLWDQFCLFLFFETHSVTVNYKN